LAETRPLNQQIGRHDGRQHSTAQSGRVGTARLCRS